ncbi:MAG TPA: hypothetical protein VIL42_10265 [Sphingomicrobium sp.]
MIDALDGLRREGRTILMIAHRRSTIARADMLIRLDNGRLANVERLRA